MYLNTGYKTHPQQMGFWGAVAGALASSAANKNGGGGAGGAGGGMPGAGGGPSATTVSPNFQQDFTAQVSPTISPIIGSPGATGGVSTPVLAAPGGQTAHGGGTTQVPSAPTSSYAPGGGVAPLSLPSLANPGMQQRFNIQDYVPRGFSPQDIMQQQRGANINQMLPWLIGGAVVITALVLFAPRRKGK